MKVVSVEYEFFKNVKDGKYDLNGKNIILLGENTVGKSNFMAGLQLVLGAKPGKHLIREGEDRAVIEAILAEYGEEQVIDDTVHRFKAVIKKQKGGGEKVELQVVMPDGEKHDTKTMIGSIAGEISLENDFVKQSATAEGKRKQLELVKSFFDQEIIEALNAQKNRLTKTYEERTEEGKESRRLKTLIESTGLKFSDFDTYKTAIDTSGITTKISEASSHNTKLADIKLRIKQRDESVDKIGKEIEELKKQIHEKQLNLSELMNLNVQAQEYLSKAAEIDVDSAQEELKVANEHNAMAKKVSDSLKWKAEHEASINRYGELTVIYDSGLETIKDAIKDMQHPIPGISFDIEDNIFYFGKLVSEDTLSFAEAKMLNIELLKAKNSNAKVIFVSNGESVGLKYLQDLQKFAEENNYEIIMEQVLRGKEELLVELMPKF